MIKIKSVFQTFIAMAVLAAPIAYAQSSPQPRLKPVSFSQEEPAFSSSLSSESDSDGQLPLPGRTERVVRNDGPRAFSSVLVGLKASSLGAGLELSTPISKHFALRGQANLTSFGYSFNIDGVHYSSRFNLGSGSAGIDWYPTHHSFRISPGVLYFNNRVEAFPSVPPGNYFELGDTGFINSVDDPLSGDAKVVFDKHFAPMLVLGVNLLGGRQSRFSIPVELGAAYTGAARINVVLNGTACTNEGCFTFADNQEAQQSMQEEIAKINKTLSDYPVYPIVTIGFAYRFGTRR